jgi:hypothetical protein
MNGEMFWRVVNWIARLTAIAAIVPILMILVGEPGTGSAGLRGWVYLALFPIGFSAGYILGWRWPVFGGCLSLACMIGSLAVIGRILPAGPYIIWSVLSIPGIMFVIAGRMLQSEQTLFAARSISNRES